MIDGNPREAGPSTIEHATVISGSAHWGMGEKFEPNKLRTMAAGSFIMIGAGSPHFGQITEDTVTQAHERGERL